MLKRTKPGLVSSNSSARLLEDVLVDRENYEHLFQGSRVRHLFSLCFILTDNHEKKQTKQTKKQTKNDCMTLLSELCTANRCHFVLNANCIIVHPFTFGCDLATEI